jgi:thiamine pyrophosphokinase
MQAFIFLNGPGRGFYREHLLATRREGDLVICADGGYGVALALGIRPDLVVGDLDSIAETVDSHVEMIRYPREKDHSDFEIALKHAREKGCGKVLVYGALGGRPDHQLTNFVILAGMEIPGVFVEEDVECYNVCDDLVIENRRGCTASLVAVGGKCRVQSIEGFKYTLREENLLPSSRGLSNVITAETARIRVTRGSLVAIILQKIPER